MSDRYGQAKSPQPMRAHTCVIRRRLEKSWDPTSSDDCPGCAVDRLEGWAQLLESIRREVFVNSEAPSVGDGASPGRPAETGPYPDCTGLSGRPAPELEDSSAVVREGTPDATHRQ